MKRIVIKTAEDRLAKRTYWLNVIMTAAVVVGTIATIFFDWMALNKSGP